MANHEDIRSGVQKYSEKKSDSKKVLLPLLQIKFGLIKQFIKVLPKESECFKYICDQFSGLSEQKLKEGALVGPIRKMIKDENFEKKMKKKKPGNL